VIVAEAGRKAIKKAAAKTNPKRCKIHLINYFSLGKMKLVPIL
jgi:hypothetical protein